MKTKYVNAGIKSQIDLAQRLLDGEVFYDSNETSIEIDREGAGDPFKSVARCVGWNFFRGLTVKKEIEWYEDPDSFPCLCWVDHFDKNPRGDKHEADIIIGYEDRCYVPQRDGTPWRYATPVTDEELKEFGLQKIDKNQ